MGFEVVTHRIADRPDFNLLPVTPEAVAVAEAV